jgi:hypothetical protein
MSEYSGRSRLAEVWYNLTVEERWNAPILLFLFAVLIGGGIFLLNLAS